VVAQSTWRRRIAVACAFAAVLLVPSAVVAVLAGPFAAAGTVVGTALTLGAATSSDRRGRRAAIVVLLAAAVFAPFVAGSPPWVALVALLGALAGLAARIGATAPISFAALLGVVAPPVDRPRDALVFASFVGLGACYSLLVARRMSDGGRATPSRTSPASMATAVVLATVFGTATGVAAAIALALDHPQGVWLPMTVLIVLGPVASDHARRNSDRVVGTVVGAAFATVVGVLGPPGWVIAGLTVAALIGVLATSGLDYWIQVTLITVLVLLGTSPPNRVADVAVERVQLTALAAVIVAAGLPLARLALRRVARADDVSMPTSP
jgi:MFS family permease